MSKDRREFLRLSALLASGIMLPFYSCNSGDSREQQASDTTATSTSGTADAGEVIDTFGIQLWSVKEDMLKDPKGTLKQLASHGYKQIESFEGQKGIFWGMSNKEFKDYVESLGMTLVSTHANVKENLEKKAAQGAEVGMKYLIDPYEGAQASLDDYKRMAERFNQYGKVCQENGLRFAYHNHEYTFKEVDSVVPQLILLEQTDPELVDFELDMYWIVAAGLDAEQHLKQHSGRYKLGHVKDRKKGVGVDVREASTELGKGSINYASVLRTAKDNGMEYFIVEQELFENGNNPIESSKQNAEYMKNLKV